MILHGLKSEVDDFLWFESDDDPKTVDIKFSEWWTVVSGFKSLRTESEVTGLYSVSFFFNR